MCFGFVPPYVTSAVLRPLLSLSVCAEGTRMRNWQLLSLCRCKAETQRPAMDLDLEAAAAVEAVGQAAAAEVVGQAAAAAAVDLAAHK